MNLLRNKQSHHGWYAMYKTSCLENSMDGGAREAAVYGIAKSWTWLSDFTLTFHFDALEKEMATHSSVLAWRIPGMGEPGGLLSMGSQRVGQDWSDLAAAATCTRPRPLCVSSHWITIPTLRGKFSWSLIMGKGTETQSWIDWAKVIWLTTTQTGFGASSLIPKPDA